MKTNLKCEYLRHSIKLLVVYTDNDENTSTTNSISTNSDQVEEKEVVFVCYWHLLGFWNLIK